MLDKGVKTKNPVSYETPEAFEIVISYEDIILQNPSNSGSGGNEETGDEPGEQD